MYSAMKSIVKLWKIIYQDKITHIKVNIKRSQKGNGWREIPKRIDPWFLYVIQFERLRSETTIQNNNACK